MSKSLDTVRVIKVFVSSPGDVQEERDVLDEAVASINRTDGQRGGFRLELFRWEDDVVPQIGPEPQEVVDLQTPVYHIYVGIMSTRFGGGGTSQEFRDAIQSWQATKSPWIIFYFNDAPKLSHKPEEVKQWLKVCEFREELESQGIVGKYAGVRGSRRGFYEQVSEHLRMTVNRLLQPNTAHHIHRSSAKPTVPTEYAEWLLSRCGDVELMGLELKHGSGVRLNHVYTPLATSAHRAPVDQQKRSPREELMGEEREAKQLLLALLND